MSDKHPHTSMAVSIGRCIAITCEGAKTWYVQGVKIVNGMEFVPLQSFDSTFCKFVIGKARFQRGASAALLELQKDRTMATPKCTSASLQLNEQLAEADKHIPRAQLMRFNKEAKLAAKSPTHVMVELGGFIHADGSVVQSIDVRMLPSLDGREKVWVQLKPDTLAFVRGALQAAERNGETRKRDREVVDGGSVVWDPVRSGFIARKGRKYKTFKVRDVHDEIAMAEGREHA